MGSCPTFYHVLARIGLGLMLVSLSACSGGTAKVEGKVHYNGQPIKGAVVVFHPVDGDAVKASRPSGVSGEDGKFTLSTQQGPGAAPGKYKVTIFWPEEEKAAEKTKIVNTDTSVIETKDRLNGRYSDSKTTPLEIEIKSGDNVLPPFELK